MDSISEPSALLQDRFGLGTSDLARILERATSAKDAESDVYFEMCITESVQLEDSLVKQAARTTSQGVGLRVVARDRAGYAHSDEISLGALQVAADTARAIAADSSQTRAVAVTQHPAAHDLYNVEPSPLSIPSSDKVALLGEIDMATRAVDPKITNVFASIVSQRKVVLIATSTGIVVGDVRPLVRINVTAIAERNGDRQSGSSGGGGRIPFSALVEPEQPGATPRYRWHLEEAARQAILNLDAVDAPAGSQTVVLGPGWPGILLHEAIGHGLEGDFNRKGTSAFAGRVGERVASELCTVVDDGTIPGRRGSLNVDDEGTPTQRTVLIENGILRGYLQDRMNASLMGVSATGNGRRESYAHLPMPRMTNTFMLAGQDDPEEIVRSVDRGLYAVNFGGGQVDITNGKFVFSASEAYEIEGGRVTRPVRGATLIGNGPDVLTRVSRVGSDLRLDDGVGTCGKDGQSVPVGVGLPTIRIDNLTVGGTNAN